MNINRRVRGVLGTAITWGASLSLLATTVLVGGLATGLVPASIFHAREVVAVAIRGFLAGSVGGALFALIVARTERHHLLTSLSAGRVARWGFLAAAPIPLVLALALGATAVLPVGVLAAGAIGFGAIGATLGGASVRIAQRSTTAELPPVAETNLLG